MSEPNTPRPVPKGNLLTRIQESYGQLRKSERIVADHLREHVGTRLNLSITELARTLGVSEATVSRVSRALGYEGFQDLKLSMAEGVGKRSIFSNIPAEIDQNDSLISTSGKLALILSTCLQGTQRMLDDENLQKVVTALNGARKIVFVGVGGAGAIGHEAAHLFSKAGLDAVSYSDGYTQIIAASNLGKDCVMVGVSHTGTTETVANALTIARKNGATTIAITSDPKSAVASTAEITLTTWNSGTPSVPLYGDFIEGRISQLYLIDILYLGVLFQAEADTGQHLQKTGRALEAFYQHKGDHT